MNTLVTNKTRGRTPNIVAHLDGFLNKKALKSGVQIRSRLKSTDVTTAINTLTELRNEILMAEKAILDAAVIEAQNKANAAAQAVNAPAVPETPVVA